MPRRQATANGLANDGLWGCKRWSLTLRKAVFGLANDGLWPCKRPLMARRGTPSRQQDGRTRPPTALPPTRPAVIFSYQFRPKTFFNVPPTACDHSAKGLQVAPSVKAHSLRQMALMGKNAPQALADWNFFRNFARMSNHLSIIRFSTARSQRVWGLSGKGVGTLPPPTMLTPATPGGRRRGHRQRHSPQRTKKDRTTNSTNTKNR